MKTFCPNCEKETDCEFQAELYYCIECEGDFAKYITSQTIESLTSGNNYWHKVATKTVNQRNKLSSFVKKIVKQGWLEGSDTLTEEATNILNDIEPLDLDGSDT